MRQRTRVGALRTGVAFIGAGLLVGSTGLVAAAAEQPDSGSQYGGEVRSYPSSVMRDGENIRQGYDENSPVLEVGDVIEGWICFAAADDYERDLVGTARMVFGDYDETIDLSNRSAYFPSANYEVTAADISRGYIEGNCTFTGMGFADASERYTQTVTSFLHVDPKAR